ncbi:MAG TPA: hypothetical protein VEA18_00315 [Candidatus Kapabacteria bacterium]|nr:hypothetical protein [Candidatus Kapabacteria bacterium]
MHQQQQAEGIGRRRRAYMLLPISTEWLARGARGVLSPLIPMVVHGIGATYRKTLEHLRLDTHSCIRDTDLLGQEGQDGRALTSVEADRIRNQLFSFIFECPDQTLLILAPYALGLILQRTAQVFETGTIYVVEHTGKQMVQWDTYPPRSRHPH